MSGFLRSQFSSVEETFLTSMIGPPSMESFAHFWSGLQLTVAEGIKLQILDEGTLAQAHVVACRVKTVTERLMDLYEKSDTFTVSFQNDLAPLFADLSIDGQSSSLSHPIPPESASSAVKAANVSATLPPYTRSVYTWLLSNLHNPYPSKEKKATIAEESGSSPKDIDNWFINVRKRIGWNKMRLKHFQNKRSLIVDAATRFFKEAPQALHPHATRISGNPKANYDSEFKSIEICARELYPELFETPLTVNESGRNLTPEAKVCAQVECSEVQGVSEELRRLYAYPTPEHSPERSPEPSAVSLPIQDIHPASSRKRRNSDDDSPELDIEDCCDEPQKRRRLDSYQFPVTQDQTTHQKNDCILPTPLIPAAPSGKRKRRLSDAGHDGLSKRPHNALAVPRLQTVSDPFPLANPIISEMYKTAFDQTISDIIPSPVSVESLDNTQVEVDFYNYDTSSDIVQSFLFPDSSDPDPALPSLLSTANSESLSLDESQVSDPSFHFQFEKYLKDLDTPSANLPSEAASKEVPVVTDIPSHDLSTLFHFENILPTQLPHENIFSNPYLQIPGLWDFQGNGDNFSTIVPSDGTLLSSDLIPSEIDPIEKEKEAKRKQIEVLLAELQSLEAKP